MSAASKPSTVSALGSWMMTVCPIFHLDLLRVCSELMGWRLKLGPSPWEARVSRKHWCSPQTQCRVSQCSATCRSLSDQVLSSTEELSLKTWTERRGGSVMKPECKLRGPWWPKPHLEFPFSLNLVTYTIEQLLNHYLKNSVIANTINIAVKWAKINKNILGIKIC